MVVGGGVYGASVALSAAERGLKVALVEAGDYASGASANSLKIIHGGLRYLKDRDIARLRRAARARAWWLRAAREVVRPLRSVVGLRPWEVPAGAMAAGLYNILTRPWQTDLPTGHRLRARVVRGAGGRGLMWYDALARQTQRLVVEMILGARGLGAEAVNYVEAMGIEARGGEVRVAVREALEGAQGEIVARAVVVAAGPKGEVLAGLRPGRWALAVNLVVARQPGPMAIGVRSPMDDPVCGPKRYIFAVPWGPGAMLGTAYWPVEGPGEGDRPTPAHLLRLLEEFEAAWPQLGLEPGDVVDYHAGLVPLDKTGRLATRRRLKVVREGEGGILVVAGAKYTTAPVVGVEVAELVCRWLGKGVGAKELPHWRLKRVGRWGRQEEEIAAAVNEEQARTLDDLIFRRLGLEEMGMVPREVAEQVGRIAARELAWSEQELARQVQRVLGRYELVRQLWKGTGRMQ